MDVKISLAVSLALNQILTGELDTSFPIELRSGQTPLRWTSPLDVKPGEIAVCPIQARDAGTLIRHPYNSSGRAGLVS
jgi:hypothetical protein